MKCELLDGNEVLIVNKTLASYIGLNESIFLRQLHFIITRNDTVGKFADGQKWYRDKPRDFAVKYFPFWDEGVVKRAINNLRADGLIMCRSDLNKNPKDRSLWYTINYPAVDRLCGPVDRITNKKAKRKAANKYTQEAKNSNSEYTKEQNVLSTTEVQNVPATEVQNVPTPKDSLPKDSNSFTNVKEVPVKKSQLEPETEYELLLFELINAERKKKGWGSINKFPTYACQKKYTQAANVLNGQTRAMIIKANEQGFIAIAKVVNYVAGCAKNIGRYSQNQTAKGQSTNGSGKHPPLQQEGQADGGGGNAAGVSAAFRAVREGRSPRTG